MQLSQLSLLGLLALAPWALAAPVSEITELEIPVNGTDLEVAGESKLERRGGYWETCRDCRFWRNGRLTLDYSEVYACECGDGRGGWPWTTVNLDHRLGNQNGRLIWNSGGFSASCHSIRLGNTERYRMQAICGDGRGSWLTNIIDLRSFMTNHHGVLTLD